MDQIKNLSKEHQDTIINAIRELDTEEKVPCCGLYHHILTIYKATDEYDFHLLHKVGRTTALSNEYANRVNSIAKGETEIDQSKLGDLMDFFDQEEQEVLKQKEKYEFSNIENYWLRSLKKVDLISNWWVIR